jgi:uncharacterized membrane protein HdeD (DUF308 family)
MNDRNKHVPCLLWPFWMIWRLIIVIIAITGRLVGAVLGLVFMIAGAVVSLTIVGLVVGIPMIIFGFMLLMRSLF